ncbi:IclR family transcriptional regulator [Oceanobacillus longus]|uniref:IclR family transcriptional regulator n=1 Tax=Oceanobacillus longus TaxID=930120 RepID=A0ABV8H254_9BACI
MDQKIEGTSLADKKYSVPAIVNAFEILKLLSRNKYKESTLTEVANAVNLTAPTCYRLLQQLKELSLVRFDNNKKRYTLGTYLVILGERAKESLDFISIIEPYLAELTRGTGLTSLLANRVDDQRLTQIAKNEGEDFGIKISIGRHFNILDGDSYGKCFLAFMNEEERDELLKNENENYRLKVVTELNDYKSYGFSWSYSKGNRSRFPGIFGVSSPIYLEKGRLELCVSVVGMTAQFTEEEVIKTIGPQVKLIADQINQEFN